MISLSEAKEGLRIPDDDQGEDGYIQLCIDEAAAWVTGRTGVPVPKRQREAIVRSGDADWLVPDPHATLDAEGALPVVTALWLDSAGAEVAVSLGGWQRRKCYAVDGGAFAGWRLRRPDGWLAANSPPERVRLRWTTGVALPDVPGDWKMCAMCIVNERYHNRAGGMPTANPTPTIRLQLQRLAPAITFDPTQVELRAA